MTSFIEINGNDVKESFPEFYHERGRFFEIIHKEQPLGFVAIGTLNKEECVLGLFIFKEYRNRLTKGIVLSLLNFPQALHFKRCWMTTAKETILKLFRNMKKYGIFEHGMLNHEQVFVKDYHGFYS